MVTKVELAERWRARKRDRLGGRYQQRWGTEKKTQIVLSGCLCGIPRHGAVEGSWEEQSLSWPSGQFI